MPRPKKQREDEESLEEKFEKIMEEALTEAENVECPPEAFYRGLRAMRGVLRVRLDVGRDECPEAFDD